MRKYETSEKRTCSWVYDFTRLTLLLGKAITSPNHSNNETQPSYSIIYIITYLTDAPLIERDGSIMMLGTMHTHNCLFFIHVIIMVVLS